MRLANRTKEADFFRKMLRGDTSQRILLIQAASGMGKTSLLAEFASLCHVQSETALLIKIDLKSAQTGIAYIFSKLQNRLGENSFTRFNAALSKFLRAGVEISDNQIEGTENQIQVVLNTESEDVRNFRLSELQRSFFLDLQGIQKPIVIILDTFNLAPASLADWIEGEFLAAVADAKNIRVVIAGQSIPKPTIEWEDIAEVHFLEPINDIEVWYPFLQEKGLLLEQQTVQAFVIHLEGQPSMILQVLESVSRRLGK
jgi:hypothetical protein